MKTFFVAAALAAAWACAPADAQNSRRVQAHDLDLSRSADVARLDRRIAAAARRVCVDDGSSLYGSYAAAKGCAREARRTAVPQRNAAIQAARGVALAVR